MNALLFDNLPRLHRRLTAPPRRRSPRPRDDVHPWPLQHGINVVLFAGMGGACQGIERTGSPVHVAVNHDRIAIAEMEVPPLTPEQWAKARRVAEFLRSHGVWNGGEIVTVGPYVIIGLLMRMLTGREAAAAHQLDLPATIRVFEKPKRGATLVDPDAVPDEFGRVWIDRPLTKTETFRLVGNSVPREMSELLWRANVPQAFAEAAE